MPRLSACIEMIFRDLSFTDRIAATKAAGLDTVEFWGWRNKDLDAIRKACGERGVNVATFGMDTGGPLTAPGDIDALLNGARESIEAARKLDVSTLLVTTGNEQAGASREAQRDLVVGKLQAVAPLLEDAGITVGREPLNSLV